MTGPSCSTNGYLGISVAALLLILPGSYARGDEPEGTIDPPKVETAAPRVIPIREREVWFRDTWQIRTNFGWARLSLRIQLLERPNTVAPLAS